MSKYIFIYHGGKMPETPEEGARVMADWMSWLAGMGDAVVDSGNPVGPSSTVQSDGLITRDGGSNPVSGYSLVSADSMEQALNMAKGCPILKMEGTVEVAVTIDI